MITMPSPTGTNRNHMFLPEGRGFGRCGPLAGTERLPADAAYDAAFIGYDAAPRPTLSAPRRSSSPPSKAAVTFLPWTAGKEKAGNVSSVMAGVAVRSKRNGLVSATESYAVSATYATLASLRTAPSRIRWAKGAENG